VASCPQNLVGFSLLDTGQKDWASRVRQAVERRPIDWFDLSLLFQFADHCVLADAQHSGRIPNAAAIQGHDLPFHPGQVSLIAVLEQKASLGADGVATPVALTTGVAAFDHLVAPTLGTANRH
jgi:hypothetical protein